MFCKHCGKEVAVSDKFCASCGKAICDSYVEEYRRVTFEQTASIESKELNAQSARSLACGILSIVFFWTVIVSFIFITINLIKIPIKLSQLRTDFINDYDRKIYDSARGRFVAAFITTLVGLILTVILFVLYVLIS